MRFDLPEPGCSPATVALTIIGQVDTAPTPVRVVPGCAQRRDGLHKEDATQFTAAIDLAVHLSRNLRGYLGNRQTYCVERPWVLAEYTIYAAVLLTLIRERQYHREATNWVRLAKREFIEPALLPVSTELEGRRIVGTHGFHLFCSSQGTLDVRAQMEIICARQHTTMAASRHNLSQLLLAVPSTVALPPTVGKLFSQALTALDQRPIRGVGLIKRNDKITDGYVSINKMTEAYDRKWNCVERSNFVRTNKSFGDMPSKAADTQEKTIKDQSTLIVEGVELSFSNVVSPFSSSRVERVFTGRQAVRSAGIKMPVVVTSEKASPFSSRRMLQVLMGKVPKSGELN